MRRMYSEKQLASIVAEVLAKDENIKWAESVKDIIYLDDDVITISESNALNVESDIYVPSFSNIENEDNVTLQEVLDTKQENPIDLSGIEETFTTNPTGNQLPDADKSSLTPEEVASIREHMLYWIRKGYIRDQNTIIKISSYSISTTSIAFLAASISLNDSGELDTSFSFNVTLVLSANSYSLNIGEI